MLASRAAFFITYSSADKALLNAAKDTTDHTTHALEKALADGANINVTDIRTTSELNWIGYKYTPLMWAVHNGQIEKVKFLIAHGADVTLQTGRGNTILHLAAREGHSTLYDYLADLLPDQLRVEGEDSLTPDKMATKYRPSEAASSVSQHSESANELSDLPVELWLYIFSYVNTQDLLSLSKVSKYFESIASDDALWMPIAKQACPSLRAKQHDEDHNVKEQLRQALAKEKIPTMNAFFTQEKGKRPRKTFETIDSSLSTQTSNAWKNTKQGAYWTLPIFTYGAGKMIAVDDRGGYCSGLENALGVILFPWAVAGDLGKAPIAAVYTAGNIVRLFVVAPINFFFGGRDDSNEEENLYQTMRYSMYAAIDGLKRLKLENDRSLAVMKQEGHLQPLMAMVCFLMAYNSLGMGKNSLLLNETIVTKTTCPRRFLSSFDKIVQLRDTMQSNLAYSSTDKMAERAIDAKRAVEWVPAIWSALKSDENYSVDNDLVQEIIHQLKDMVAMLVKSDVGKEVSVRMAKRLG